MTSKSNKWVEHIKKYAADNGLSYRQAMRDDGCKTAYKSPEPERSPSPVRSPSPEPELVSTPVKKGRGKKMLVQLPEPELPVPTLVRSEVETIPVVKKERAKRSPKFVPT
jgi:hypothetical protein